MTLYRQPCSSPTTEVPTATVIESEGSACGPQSMMLGLRSPAAQGIKWSGSGRVGIGPLLVNTTTVPLLLVNKWHPPPPPSNLAHPRRGPRGAGFAWASCVCAAARSSSHSRCDKTVPRVLRSSLRRLSLTLWASNGGLCVVSPLLESMRLGESPSCLVLCLWPSVPESPFVPWLWPLSLPLFVRNSGFTTHPSMTPEAFFPLPG
jgi:hypothetical protein